MYLKEKMDELSTKLKKKITYEAVAPVLGLGSKQAAQNRDARKQQLKEWEIAALDEAFLSQSVNINNQKDLVSIDYYPEVFGSCGSGKFILSEQKELIRVPKKLFGHFSPQKQYSIINAIGDSMLPYIHNKDKLIVEHWQGEQIKDNQVYVFCYKDEIFVKRLIKNIDEIIVKSDNPDPMYRPRYIEKEDMNNVLIVGEIVGLMRDMR